MSRQRSHRRTALLCGAFLLALLVFLPAGCAYYNTFYLAKKYYAQAQRSVEKSESEKLPPEAAKKYDDAITQAGKVLAYHGGSRWVDDAVYLMGASYYGKREFEPALKKFDELLANYPKTNLAASAHYMSGLCHYEMRNYEEMESSFHKALEKEPGFDKRDDILFTEARAAETQRNRGEAVRRYRELVRQFPKSRRAEEGLQRIGDLYFDAGRADSAYTSYEDLARVARTEVVHREARIKASDALIRLDRATEAVEILKKLLPDDESASVNALDEGPPRVYIALAKAYNSLGRHAEAIEALKKVTQRYAASSPAAEAQFQVGYTYEVYIDNPDSARKAYEDVGRIGGRSVFREQATLRAQNLQQLQRLATEAQSDSASSVDKQAEATLKIAELLLFAQDRPPEALAKYREVLGQYPDSRMAPRAAYAAAWIQLKKTEGKRDSALAAFTELVHRYPSSRQAKGALDILVAEKADTTGLTALVANVEPDTLEAEPEPLPTSPPMTSEPDSGLSTSPGEELLRREEMLRGRRDPLRPGEFPARGPEFEDSLMREMRRSEGLEERPRSEEEKQP